MLQFLQVLHSPESPFLLYSAGFCSCQASQQSCNEGGILTHVEPEQQNQPQDEFEYEELCQGWSEYGEELQPTEQPQEQSKPEVHCRAVTVSCFTFIICFMKLIHLIGSRISR